MRRGPEAIRYWISRNQTSANKLGAEIGDTSGQVAKWITGARETTPLGFKVALAKRTGIRLELLLTADELETARELFCVFARDCAGKGAAA